MSAHSLLQCPGGAFTPDIKTTKEFPDDVVTFVRNHPVMFNPVYPVGRRPLVVRTNADYKYTSVAVDQVIAADGNYQVLFLGTGTNVYTVKCCGSTLCINICYRCSWS